MAKVSKTNSTTLINFQEEVLAHIDANISRALQAVGTEAVGKVVQQMETGYGKPIRDTGDLMRDVNYQAEPTADGGIVRIGNSLEYAPFVHDGTRFMDERPYLRDGINNNWDRLKEVWAAYLKEGF